MAVANNNLGIAYTALYDLDRATDHQNKAIAELREIDDLRNLEDALGEPAIYIYSVTSPRVPPKPSRKRSASRNAPTPPWTPCAGRTVLRSR